MADNQITPFQLTDQFTMDNFNQRINETNTALQNKADLGTVYSKPETLSDTTKATFGLDATAVPDDALAVLSRFHKGLGNEYVWKREQVVDGIIPIEFNVLLNSVPDSNSSYTFEYYDSVSVEEGVIVASGKHTTTLLDFSNNVDYKTAKKYRVNSSGIVYEITKVVSLEYSSTPYHDMYGNKLGVGDVTVTTYVNSPDPSAYPPAVSDGYTYTALGQLGNKVQIATGSYTGTGTYGSSNPNSLTFEFEPKAVCIVSNNESYGGGLVWVYGSTYGHSRPFSNSTADFCILNWAERTLSWYTTGAISQLNDSGKKYYYIAIG